MNKLILAILLILLGCGQKIEEKAGGDSTVPIAVKDQASIDTGQSVTIDLSSNDSDTGENLDKTTISLGVSVGGSCEFDPSSPFVKFTPSVGFAGIGSCAYSICDEEGNCGNSSFEVIVHDKNPPQTAKDFGSTAINTATVPINVALNDNDLEGDIDTESVTILGTPASQNGTCTIPESPNVIFTPDNNFIGIGSCSYQICDDAPTPNCAEGVIEVTMQDNVPPLVTDDSGTTDTASGALIIDPSANDTDPGNNLDTSSVSIAFGVGGSCAVTTSPNISFTPNVGFTGTGSCGYQICDTNSNCSTGVIVVTVNDASAPTANVDSTVTSSGVASSSVNVALNDVDVENNLDTSSVTVLASPAPVGGACVVTTSPNIVFTPSAGFSGAGSCSYQICDTQANCSTAILNVDVQDKTPPVTAQDTASTDSSGTVVTVDVSSNDSDPENNLDTSSVGLSFAIGGTCSFNTASPNVQFEPRSGYIGTGNCGYRICDTANNCSNDILEITVTDGVAPSSNDDIASTNDSVATQTINVALNDSDPENNLNQASVTISTNAANGNCVVTSSPNIVYTPNATFTGVDSCVYQICDNANNCSTASLNVQVNDSSFPLAINDITTATSADTVNGVTFDVSANDSDGQGNLDPTSVTLGIQSGGTCSLNTAPSVKFVPNTGFIGNGSCGYTICDLDNNCSNAVLNISVSDAVNPVANNDSHQTNAGVAASAFDVSANDTDVENNLDILSVTITATPAVGGTCNVTNSPLVQFTPNAGFVGNGSCEYQICDNATNCNTAVLTVTVLDASSPVAVNDNTSMNTSLANISFDVLANDTDPENNLDASSLSVLSSSGGNCTTSSPNLIFTPNSGFIGQASCNYQICDTSTNCTSSSLFVNVTDGVAPVVNNDSITVSAGEASPAVNVISNDSDLESNLDSSSVTISSAASNGTCSVSTSPLVIYTPGTGFSGSDSCDYQVCDNAPNCSTATINITVQDQTPPVVTDDTDSMNTTDAFKTVDVLANDNDPENNLDNASLTITFNIGGTCTPAAPNITFTPNAGFTGQGSCGYQICDLSNNCASGALTIDIIDTSAPITNPDLAATDSGQMSGFINVASNDIDPEGRLDLTSVTVLATPPAVGGTCVVANSPFITFTPNAGFNGSGSCAYQICDLDSNCSNNQINITVNDRTPPVVVDDTISINQNNSIGAIDVTSNDNDPESNLDTSSVTIVNGSHSNGICSVSSPNITFTPNTDFAGVGGCDYQVCDTFSNCSQGSVVVTVNDITVPTVTINQAAVQTDPTNILPIIYEISFSEPIDTTTFTIADIDKGTSTAAGGIFSLINAGDDQNFTLFVYALSSNGDLALTIPAGSVSDKNGLATTAISSFTDNTVSYDAIAPAAAIINSWTWAMSSPNDETFSQDGTPQISLSGVVGEDGAEARVFDDNACLSPVSSSQTIASGMANFTDISYAVNGTADGVKIFYAQITDAVGNISPCTPLGLNYTLDTIKPTVTINQLASQADPTKDLPIVFQAVFSEPIEASSFTATDITNNGTAQIGTWNIQAGVDTSTFTMTIVTMNEDGTIIPSLAAGVIEDFALNTNEASTSTDNLVTYDSTPPILTIVSAPNITLDNDDSWPINGTCDEIGEEVEVILEPGNIPGNIKPLNTVFCQAPGNWSTTIDTRSISTDGSYTVQVRHVDGVGLESIRTAPVLRKASCTSTPDIITDLATANITQQTVDLSWITPASNNTDIVDYLIEFRELSSVSDWTEFPHTPTINNFFRVTSLNINANYEFRVRAIGDLTSGSTTGIECIADLSNVATATTKPNHPFFDPFDYELVNLYGAEKSVVGALEDGTQVKVYADYANYLADTPIETIPLDEGDTALIDTTTAAYSGVTKDEIIAYSLNPIYISGRLTNGTTSTGAGNIANVVWLNPLWAEKELAGNSVRSGAFPSPIIMRTFEPGTNIDIYEGTTLLQSYTNIAANQNITYSIADDPGATTVNVNGVSTVARSFRISSNKFVAAVTYSTNSSGTTRYDAKPFLPQSRKLLGVPSRGGFLGTSSSTNVNLSIYHSDGTVQTTIINNSCVDTTTTLSLIAGSALTVMPYVNGSCTTSSGQYSNFQPEVIYIEADGNIAGNNVADGDGVESVPFVPVELKKRRYVIPTLAQWIVLASDLPVNITRKNPNGSTASIALARTGAGPFNAKTPYRIRLTNVDAGTIFEGDSVNDVFVGWYEGNNNVDGVAANDETLLYGFD